MWGSLDISVSGMVAQRTRHAAIAANLANSETLLNAAGEYEPYKRREVMFAPGDPTSPTREGRAMGVHVERIHVNEDALRARYDPTSPFADERGIVMVPDISPAIETINSMQAVRAYEANVQAAEVTKQMLAQALRLLA